MEFTKDAVKIVQAKMILPRMKERGLNTNQLSKITGISQPFLSQWFSGDTDISLSRFMAILTALDINIHLITKESDTMDYSQNRINFN